MAGCTPAPRFVRTFPSPPAQRHHFMKSDPRHRRSVFEMLLQFGRHLALAALMTAGTATGSLGQGISPEEVAELSAMELPVEGATLLAIVGNSPILLGELMPKVDERLAQVAKGDISKIPPEQLKVVRLKLLRSLLTQTIQTKMLGHAFLMTQVGSSSTEQRRDAQSRIAAQARKAFYEGEVPRMLKQLEVNSIQEVDAKLREQGSSLKALEHEYQDKMLGAVYIQKLIPRDPEVTLNELQRYYSAHRDEFDNPARARWEQLTVLFENFPSRQDADRAIREMGREVYYGGNMQSVAKERSQEPFGKTGGVHDWTRRGSLASKPLEEQIFSLPLDHLSDIIEDSEGLHIVRVLERKEAGMTPLAEVQDGIRKKIRQQKMADAEKKVLENLHRDVPVWSLYPQDVEGALPLDPSGSRPYAD